MRPSMKHVAVVIVHFRHVDETVSCLRALNQSSIPNIELQTIVVDNGGNSEVEKEIKPAFPTIHVIEQSSNTGFSGGNNVGIEWVLNHGFEYIFILNNDAALHKDTIQNLTLALNEHVSWGIAAPKIYFSAGREFHYDRYKEPERGKVIWYAGGLVNWNTITGSHRGVDEVDAGQFEREEETDFASGCAMMVRKEVFSRIGLFDERFFLYYEDLDFSMKAKHAGFTIGFYPKAFLWHKNAASSDSRSNLQDYYISRNRLLFGYRWAPSRSKLFLFKESLSIFLKGRPWQKRGVRDYYLGNLGKGSYEAK